MTEKEFKVLISQNDYNRIKKLCSDSEQNTVIQTNYYFDTEDFFFKREDATLRVREKNGEYTFTVKVTGIRIEEKGIKESTEYSYKIDYPSFERLCAGGAAVIEIIPELEKSLPLWKDCFSGIKMLGKLVTERIKFRPGEGVPFVELDRNSYLDFTDFELECEVENSLEVEKFEEWMGVMGLSATQPMKGKYGRFTSRLKTLRKIL